MFDGVININKPRGITSHDAVYKLRRITGLKKIGHTGTLDPMASGVLPILTGKGTKLSDYFIDNNKRYEATVELGVSTDSYDMEGRVVKTSDKRVSDVEINAAVSSFVGELEQIPPMYSAIKIGGKKLYQLARKGIEVERSARKITIFNIDVLNIDGKLLTVDISCSKGTYIRSLCNDIGELLGTGARLTALVRSAAGCFKLEDSVELADLTAENFAGFVRPMDSFFDYPKIIVDGLDLLRTLNGTPLKASIGEQGQMYRVYSENGTFLSLSKQDCGRLKLVRIFY